MSAVIEELELRPSQIPAEIYAEAVSLMDQSGIKEWIRDYAVFAGTKLDFDETLKQLGLELWFDDYLPCMGTLEYGEGMDPAIVISDGADDAEAELTIGHELGHYFLEAVKPNYHIKNGWSEAHTEAFCELFGYHLLMPKQIVLGSHWGEL